MTYDKSGCDKSGCDVKPRRHSSILVRGSCGAKKHISIVSIVCIKNYENRKQKEPNKTAGFGDF